MSTTIFHEVQRIRQWWVWTVILLIDSFFVFIFVLQVILHKPVGDDPAPDALMYFLLLVVVMLSLLVALVRLETSVDESGMHYRFIPFLLRKRSIGFDELSEIYVRKYNPIFEYGGWGLRLGLFGKGQALNISGNIGLQLVFHSGKRLLIGTQTKDALEKALRDLGVEKLPPKV